MSTSTTGIATAQFGVIGLGVMGENLALNVEDHGHSVAVWNLETDWVDRFVQNNHGRQVIGARTLPEFCRSLERPRRILMMIKAGDPIDQTLHYQRADRRHAGFVHTNWASLVAKGPKSGGSQSQ